MKSQITLNIENDIKNQFEQIANKMWADVSMLVNMYFVQVINSWRVEFYTNDNEPVEIWFIPMNNLSKDEINEIKNLKDKPLSSFINI
jgi:antitoxin component of RelBE/YafQ-DinJ toxin-antitoxin module